MSAKPPGVFDFVNSISFSKVEFTPEEIQKSYDPYITVLAFANHPDTIHIANALNCFKTPINKYNHYTFLYHMIRKKKRFSEFFKNQAKKNENAKIVSAYYGYSIQKAEGVLPLLKEEDLKYMSDYLNDVGGVQK